MSNNIPVYEVEYLELDLDEIEILDIDDYNGVADQILNDRPALYLVD